MTSYEFLIFNADDFPKTIKSHDLKYHTEYKKKENDYVLLHTGIDSTLSHVGGLQMTKSFSDSEEGMV